MPKCWLVGRVDGVRSVGRSFGWKGYDVAHTVAVIDTVVNAADCVYWDFATAYDWLSHAADLESAPGAPQQDDD